uniref:Uncharacterized protein n=1 Tax=Panagrolaimus sp. PS1159 TaxID=55785 RepID=A0AC35FSB1_9BILA
MPKVNKLPANPIQTVVLKNLDWDNEEKIWRTSDKRGQWSTFNDDQLNNGGKFKIKDELSVNINIMDVFDAEGGAEMQNITSKLLKRVESCDLEYLCLENQNITFDEYLKLTATKKIECLFMDMVDIRYADGTIVPFDRVLAEVPKLHKMVIQGDYTKESKFNSETAKKLSELPKFENLWVFELHDISDAFNVDDFCNFILKHKAQKVDYDLHLDDMIDEDYETKFHAAMNKIIEEWDGEHKISIMVNGDEYPFEC